ncbi:MAG: SDR family oxidoreductase [Candidatus Eremiobacteraeota bacterium]|nr:SDR family oxidoreductase [Candidatus Eremiobacteraeota bacterium]
MQQQRIAVITGTSTGFGYQIAEKLTHAGIRVYGTMRDVAGRNAGAKSSLEALGVTVVELDVTDQASVDRGAAAILAEAGHVDIVINNAGNSHSGVTEAFTPESIERQYATNVIGPIRISRAFLPGMRERESGLVVFVSSVVGRVVIPFLGVYASSKWALEALAESLSYELRPFDVDIAIVEPGAYATNISNVRVAPDDTARVEAYGATAKIFERVGAALAAGARDASEVGDAVLALVETPAGTRPLRTPVPAQSPAEAVNAAVTPIQRGVLEAYGLGELLPKTHVTA